VAGVITHQKIQFNFLKTKIQKRHLMNRRIKIATATLALILIATFNAVAQPYGHSEYVNANGNYILGKGLYYQGATPGFVMAGHAATATPGTPNFVVYRTSPGGGLTGPTAWTNGYRIIDCVSGNQVITTDHSNMITCVSPVFDFLVATVNKEALYLTGVEATGLPGGSMHLRYGFPPNTINASKPHLVQLANTDIVVCGSYDLGGLVHMYIIKITNTALPIASNGFKLAQGVSITPNDIIESPFNNYSTDELAIVGDFNDGSKDNGFLLLIDHSTWATLQLNQFTNTLGSFESLGSITVASGAGNYMIHGVTNATTGGTKRPTCMQVAPNGSTTVWSYWYSAIGNMTAVCIPKQIIERPNTYSSNYDYFMGYSITNQIKVSKIDPNGIWFNQTGNIENDGQYGTTGYNGQSISYNNQTGNDEGIHVYGNTNTNNFFLVQAHFNLYSNFISSGTDCIAPFETINPSALQSTTSPLSSGPSLNLTSGPNECGNIIIYSLENVSRNQICGGDNSDPNGNNQRKTNLAKNIQLNITIKPTLTDKELFVDGLTNFSYKFIQLDGKVIRSGHSSGLVQTEDLSNGLYVLTISDGTLSYNQKIVISH